MVPIPSIALSVRQPWAWAIIHAGKDIENRSWHAVDRGTMRRGRIAIHAAKGLTQQEYRDAADYMLAIGVRYTAITGNCCKYAPWQLSRFSSSYDEKKWDKQHAKHLICSCRRRGRHRQGKPEPVVHGTARPGAP